MDIKGADMEAPGTCVMKLGGKPVKIPVTDPVGFNGIIPQSVLPSIQPKSTVKLTDVRCGAEIGVSVQRVGDSPSQ